MNNYKQPSSYFFVGFAAFILDGLNASPQVVLLSRFGNDNIVPFLLYILLFILLYPRIRPSYCFGLLAFLIGELFNRIEVLLEVDFPSILEFLFRVQEFLLGYDVVIDHMMCYFAPEFIAEVAKRLGEDLRSSIRQFLVFLLFFLLGLLLLDLFDL